MVLFSNTSLFLIQLISIWIGGLDFKVLYDKLDIILEYLAPNNNHNVIQSHYSKSELLFWVYCFCIVVFYFSICNRYTGFEEKHVNSNFCMFPCLRLDNYPSISFFYCLFCEKLIMFYVDFMLQVIANNLKKLKLK